MEGNDPDVEVELNATFEDMFDEKSAAVDMEANSPSPSLDNPKDGSALGSSQGGEGTSNAASADYNKAVLNVESIKKKQPFVLNPPHKNLTGVVTDLHPKLRVGHLRAANGSLVFFGYNRVVLPKNLVLPTPSNSGNNKGMRRNSNPLAALVEKGMTLQFDAVGIPDRIKPHVETLRNETNWNMFDNVDLVANLCWHPSLPIPNRLVYKEYYALVASANECSFVQASYNEHTKRAEGVVVMGKGSKHQGEHVYFNNRVLSIYGTLMDRCKDVGRLLSMSRSRINCAPVPIDEDDEEVASYASRAKWDTPVKLKAKAVFIGYMKRPENTGRAVAGSDKKLQTFLSRQKLTMAQFKDIVYDQDRSAAAEGEMQMTITVKGSYCNPSKNRKAFFVRMESGAVGLVGKVLIAEQKDLELFGRSMVNADLSRLLKRGDEMGVRVRLQTKDQEKNVYTVTNVWIGWRHGRNFGKAAGQFTQYLLAHNMDLQTFQKVANISMLEGQLTDQPQKASIPPLIPEPPGPLLGRQFSVPPPRVSIPPLLPEPVALPVHTARKHIVPDEEEEERHPTKVGDVMQRVVRMVDEMMSCSSPTSLKLDDLLRDEQDLEVAFFLSRCFNHVIMSRLNNVDRGEKRSTMPPEPEPLPKRMRYDDRDAYERQREEFLYRNRVSSEERALMEQQRAHQLRDLREALTDEQRRRERGPISNQDVAVRNEQMSSGGRDSLQLEPSGSRWDAYRACIRQAQGGSSSQGSGKPLLGEQPIAARRDCFDAGSKQRLPPPLQAPSYRDEKIGSDGKGWIDSPSPLQRTAPSSEMLMTEGRRWMDNPINRQLSVPPPPRTAPSGEMLMTDGRRWMDNPINRQLPVPPPPRTAPSGEMLMTDGRSWTKSQGKQGERSIESLYAPPPVDRAGPGSRMDPLRSVSSLQSFNKDQNLYSRRGEVRSIETPSAATVTSSSGVWEDMFRRYRGGEKGKPL